MTDTSETTSMDSHGRPTGTPDESRTTYGLLAEFDQVGCLLGAAEKVRDAGFRHWDCFTPFPVHRLDKAMGIHPTRLPWLVLIAGLTGAIAGVGLTIYTMSTSIDTVPTILQGYPYLISGKPYNSFPAFIPVIFELTILLASLAAVFGMLIRNGLPKLYHPLFRAEAFRRVTDDRFFLAVEADDPKYDEAKLTELLRGNGATDVQTIEDHD